MTRPELSLVVVVASHPQATLVMTKNRIAHNRKMWIHAPPKKIEVVAFLVCCRQLDIVPFMHSALTCLLLPIFTGQTGQYRHHGVPDPNLPRHLRGETLLSVALRNRAISCVKHMSISSFMNHAHDGILLTIHQPPPHMCEGSGT